MEAFADRLAPLIPLPFWSSSSVLPKRAKGDLDAIVAPGSAVGQNGGYFLEAKIRARLGKEFDILYSLTPLIRQFVGGWQ